MKKYTVIFPVYQMKLLGYPAMVHVRANSEAEAQEKGRRKAECIAARSRWDALKEKGSVKP